MSVCVKCGKTLTYNEIGAYRKFVNRGGKDCLCEECLAKRLVISPERIDQKIEEFKLQGCTLFV